MASLNGARVFLAIRHNIFARQLNPINGHCRNALLLVSLNIFSVIIIYIITMLVIMIFPF